MSDTDGSESGSDTGVQAERTFQLPPQNATMAELREARSHNLLHLRLMNEALKENKELRATVTKHEASKPGRKGKKSKTAIKGEDISGYHTKIVALGKSFGMLFDPWVPPVVFSKKVVAPLATPTQIFAKGDSPLYHQYLTASLYTHVPEKFHELVDSAVYSNFSDNFLHYLNSQRSTAIHTLKQHLPIHLLKEKVVPSLDPTNLQRLLIHSGEDPELVKISTFPPIFYDGLNQNVNKLFVNKILPLAARCILFGPASLADGGTRKPASSTVGYMWKVTSMTPGFMVFVCTACVFVIYWHKEGGKIEDFNEIGDISKISFRKIFMRILRALKVKAEASGTKRILRFWQQTVFHGITGAAAAVQQTPSTGVDSEEEFIEALEGLDLDSDPRDDNILGDWDFADNPVPAPHAVPARRAAERLGAPSSMVRPAGKETEEYIYSDEDAAAATRPAARRKGTRTVPLTDDSDVLSDDISAPIRPAGAARAQRCVHFDPEPDVRAFNATVSDDSEDNFSSLTPLEEEAGPTASMPPAITTSKGKGTGRVHKEPGPGPAPAPEAAPSQAPEVPLDDTAPIRHTSSRTSSHTSSRKKTAPPPQPPEATTKFTKHGMMQALRLGGGRQDGLVKEMDPDAVNRGDGRMLAADDTNYEKGLAQALVSNKQYEDDSIEEDLTDAWVGNRRRQLWKSACTRSTLNVGFLQPNISEQDRILYAALAPSLQTSIVLKPACRTWEDHLWAQISVVCEEKQSMEILRAGAQHPFHYSQLQIILNRIGPLMENFAAGVQDGTYAQALFEYTRMCRFFAHLCHFLQMIDIPVPPLATQVILESYLQVLEAAGQRDLIVMHAGALGDNAVERYALFLVSLELSVGIAERRLPLTRAREHEQTIEKTFELLPPLKGRLPSIIVMQPPPSDEELFLLRSIKWTVFTDATYETALQQTNVIGRYFLGNLPTRRRMGACHRHRCRLGSTAQAPAPAPAAIQAPPDFSQRNHAMTGIEHCVVLYSFMNRYGASLLCVIPSELSWLTGIHDSATLGIAAQVREGGQQRCFRTCEHGAEGVNV
ncbi:hypothetical protein FB451DRAFT_1481251 [Mycena latifolia]|nr:hypothetical protein FB451DRAFT_1481251 [Mycena latifolia]